MHLKHIKLAGFKSFAEPTQIPVPGRLVGVVGPNGCGKSNVIDAVRWVLGESQARQLRGETLQDVIFGGTTARKPLGRASVELVFDNTDGRAPGQWSNYAEIAVRRVLARDGVSNYYINNVHVRRRDVQDMFLGTGLGPRAYAIIEQGMISRIVESRPEEIRVFLEEAAGISRYRERRRETESRLEDARRNLTRTEDVRQELARQMDKLQGQAEIAARWHALQHQLLQTRNLLSYVRKREAQALRLKLQRDLEQTTLDLDAILASVRHVEAQLELQRSAQQQATEACNVAQGALYETNALVSQTELQLQTQRAQSQRLLQEQTRLHQEWQDDQKRLEDNATLLTRTQEELTRAQDLVQVNQERVQQEQARLPEQEQQAAQQRRHLERLRQQEAQLQSQISAARAGQQTGQRLLRQLQERHERLSQEQAQLVQPSQGELDQLSQACREQAVTLGILQANRKSLEERLQWCQATLAGAHQALETALQEHRGIEARLKALEALQQRLGVETQARELVHKHGLAQAPRLWEQLRVDPGWEVAVEAVLGARLNALHLPSLEGVARWEMAEYPAGICLYADCTPPLDPVQEARVHSSGAADDTAALTVLTPLVERIQARTPAAQALLHTALSAVYSVQDLPQALALQPRLEAGMWLVTPAGLILQRNSVQFFAPQGAVHGALARAREITELQQQVQVVQQRSAHLAQEKDQAHIQAQQQMQALEALQIRIREGEAHGHGLDLQRTRAQAQQERLQLRVRQLQEGLQDLALQQAQEQQHLQDFLAQEQQARAQADAALQERTQVEQAWRAAEQARDAQRLALHSAERALQEATYLEKSTRERVQHLRHTQHTLQQRQEQRVPRQAALARELAQGEEEALQARLQQALASRSEREKLLSVARQELEACQVLLRELDQQRVCGQQQQDPLRQRLGQLQLKEQEAHLHLLRAQEELDQNQAQESLLETLLEANTRPATLLQQCQNLQQQIDALGAVNLAALEELTTAQNRRQWLEDQVSDLNSAVTTLEQAMQRIDRETREQLRDTFDRVNAGFSTLFPSLFGGGHARIELTGEEILDAGVFLVAQPPGKKTTSIHLLSGGEKALTALSLVFALFQLNPAPFCLLDEVDAPLDDANTERFANLVKRMSQHTQFLFITHNKIAMEMAQQLVGITMAESGVSRMVAVDIEEAVRLSEESVV